MDVANTIWVVSYFAVLIGLSAYGMHRISIVYLFLKHQAHRPQPKSHFETLPKVTVQLQSSNGLCWGAEYSAAVRNDAAQFKARSD